MIAESFERIHRSNLIGMGVLPLQFPEGQSAQSLGIDGARAHHHWWVCRAAERGRAAEDVHGARAQGDGASFEATVRIDTPKEADYFRHGGILQYVLRQLLAGVSDTEASRRMAA